MEIDKRQNQEEQSKVQEEAKKESLSSAYEFNNVKNALIFREWHDCGMIIGANGGIRFYAVKAKNIGTNEEIKYAILNLRSGEFQAFIDEDEISYFIEALESFKNSINTTPENETDTYFISKDNIKTTCLFNKQWSLSVTLDYLYHADSSRVFFNVDCVQAMLDALKKIKKKLDEM